jgi:hypothetical protein
MGLLEKRALKAFQDGAYKKLTSEINDIAGFNVKFEINWDTLALDEQSHLYEESFPKNEGAIYYGSAAYSFDNGVLTIDHQPTTNIDSIQERSEELAKILMKQM